MTTSNISSMPSAPLSEGPSMEVELTRIPADDRPTSEEEYKQMVNEDEEDAIEEDLKSEKKNGCCFSGNTMANGLAMVNAGRGAIVMSNIFMSTALIYLASEAAGCFDEEGNVDKGNCDTKIYGFLPASLISNIAVITGFLSALLMPLIGAIVDFTPFRRETGIASAVVLMVIQGLQIFTVSATWFPMAILQAIAGFVYQIQVLATYAYLPELAADVGEKTMTNYTSKLTMFQFSAQAAFLLLISILAFVFRLTDVLTARYSQIINCCWILVAFSIGWIRMLPKVGTSHERLPEGTSNLCSAGFAQLWRTAKSINTHYRRSLRWYYLALMFAEAGVNSFTVVAVTFQTAHLGMSGAEIGIQFLVVLICTIPGTKIAELVTKKLDAKKSWIICLATFGTITAVAAFVLGGPSMKTVSYAFIALWGVTLGWFYSTENLLFSFLLPKGQESEMSGIYVYCTQIIVWMPPLLFTLMYENGISMQWGLLSLVLFMGVAIGLIACMAPWDVMLEEVSKPIPSVNDEHFSASENLDYDVDPIEAAEP